MNLAISVQSDKDLTDQVTALRAALVRIAAYNDRGANDQLALSGSYSGFDEPRSVRIAREALKGGQG